MGEILIKKYGVKSVVAIDSENVVLEETVIRFSQEFLGHLSSGESIKKSFDLARSKVRTNSIESGCKYCCCHLQYH